MVINITNMVSLNVRVPASLKKEALDMVEFAGYKDLSEFVREALRMHVIGIKERVVTKK